jgi:hypothetical protein
LGSTKHPISNELAKIQKISQTRKKKQEYFCNNQTNSKSTAQNTLKYRPNRQEILTRKTSYKIGKRKVENIPAQVV